MTDRLDAYRSKRDFGSTPEPGPGEGGDAAEQPRFVVHEHHARRLHWDLRLERDGVLVSWAVPKGIPPDPKRNHLAVHTEDHPIEYIDFAGEIPAGQYGAGVMKIWDSGTYETHKFRDKEVMITFHGERLHGRYVLFRTRGDDWMIHRMDPPEDPEREPMPEHLAPMLATTGKLPRDEEGWAFEIKWDGVRSIAYAQGGTLRLESRNGRDITPRYPELRELGRALGAREAIFDGEVVAFDGGRPSFQKLQGRMHLTSEHAVRRLAASDPVTYMIFDLLYLDGHSLMDQPYEERRATLLELGLSGPAWQAPAHHIGDGERAAGGLEGAGPGGDHRQAPGLHLHAGPALERLGEGEEHPPHRRRHRRLAAGRGRALRAPRRARHRLLQGRRAALRRARGDGLHRGRAGAARRAAGAARARGQPVRGPPAAEAHALRRAAPRVRGRLLRGHERRHACASRPTRGCATTSSPRRSGRRS